MKITESLKDYLTVDQNEWVMKDDYSRHILDYDGENEPWYIVISDADLEFLQHWTEKNGQFPIFGRLISANSSGEHEWKFSNNGHAKGGYCTESVSCDDQGDVQESSDTFDCPYTYLFGDDLSTVKKALLKILFHNCGVGVVDETELCGWLYIVDLSNAKSYYGSMETIFPPNYSDGQNDSECSKGPQDMDYYMNNDNEMEFPDLKDL
jgi:hypothetical protein